MGPAVLNGGVSTFLAFLLLAGSRAQVFQTFFKVCYFYFLIVDKFPCSVLFNLALIMNVILEHENYVFIYLIYLIIYYIITSLV